MRPASKPTAASPTSPPAAPAACPKTPPLLLHRVISQVGSPSNQHWEMQTVLRDEYEGDVHISTGMTTKEEIEKIVTFWEEGKGDAKNRLILYNCTSGACACARLFAMPHPV